MCLGSESDSGRALLHGLECILDLVQPALWREDGVVGIVSVTELQCGMKLSAYICLLVSCTRTMV